MLDELVKKIHKNNLDAGWWNDPVTGEFDHLGSKGDLNDKFATN